MRLNKREKKTNKVANGCWKMSLWAFLDKPFGWWIQTPTYITGRVEKSPWYMRDYESSYPNLPTFVKSHGLNRHRKKHASKVPRKRHHLQFSKLLNLGWKSPIFLRGVRQSVFCFQGEHLVFVSGFSLSRFLGSHILNVSLICSFFKDIDVQNPLSVSHHCFFPWFQNILPFDVKLPRHGCASSEGLLLDLPGEALGQLKNQVVFELPKTHWKSNGNIKGYCKLSIKI